MSVEQLLQWGASHSYTHVPLVSIAIPYGVIGWQEWLLNACPEQLDELRGYVARWTARERSEVNV